MRHSKIFKAEDGTKYEIVVEVYSSFSEKAINDMQVYVCEPGKRKFRVIAHRYSDEWEFRKLSTEQQHEYRKNAYMKVVKREWLEEVLDELLNKVKMNYLKEWGE